MACFGQQADVKYGAGDAYFRCHEYKEDIQLDRQGPEMVAVIYSLYLQKGVGMKPFRHLLKSIN
ncbi:hypothetical protein ABKP09_08735 [Peribacillus frigoritolerans]|uniref:hypothetical protein n=1 Tax=Peribacillus frigoritolerans TaxID=450367 RepID=UPI0032B59350